MDQRATTLPEARAGAALAALQRGEHLLLAAARLLRGCCAVRTFVTCIAARRWLLAVAWLRRVRLMDGRWGISSFFCCSSLVLGGQAPGVQWSNCAGLT
jgi:hypothetical protein